MNSPCNECIVLAMCHTYCVLLEDYVNSSLGYNHEIVHLVDFLELKDVLLYSEEHPTQPFERSVRVFTHGSYNCPFTVYIKNGEIYGAHG